MLKMLLLGFAAIGIAVILHVTYLLAAVIVLIAVVVMK